MQNNFGEAIRNNIGVKDGMYNAIWAIFKDKVIIPGETVEEQHNLCPRDDWCPPSGNPPKITMRKNVQHMSSWNS